MKKTEDKLKQAIQTYNKIASIYAKYTEDRLMQFQLSRFESMLPGKRILDAGCGSGRDVEYFMEDGFDAIGVDLSLGLLKEAKKRVPKGKFKKTDFRKMIFKAKTFHGIWSVSSLFHMPKEEVQKALKEFNRVLDDSGVLYISIKRGKGSKEIKKEKYQNEPMTVYFYEQKEMEDLVCEAGFKIHSSEANDVWVEIFAEKKQ
ncbi:class I SAM-dependent methyltransferase [archaeon]|nr:class I SAM-dependent methyltransferase [archaeon]